MKRKIERAIEESKPELKGKRRRPLPEVEYETVAASEEAPDVQLDGAVLEAMQNEAQGKRTKYTTITVRGSKGQTYRVTVPDGIAVHVPKTWRWDARKLRVADQIAQGVRITDIVRDPENRLTSKATVYGWLYHPEFREHVDALVLEMEFASKRERIAGMNRVTRILFDKLVRELSTVRMTDKSVGSLLSGFSTLLKQIAQEKEEFVEQARVEQEVHADVKGTVATASIPLEQYLATLPKDEREEMEREFAKVADEYIAQLRGDTPIKPEGEDQK